MLLVHTGKGIATPQAEAEPERMSKIPSENCMFSREKIAHELKQNKYCGGD